MEDGGAATDAAAPPEAVTPPAEPGAAAGEERAGGGEGAAGGGAAAPPEEKGADGEEVTGSLPLARVKRIMRLDKDVKHVTQDATRVITRATELFVESLAAGAHAQMLGSKRKTIKYADIEQHVLRKPRLEFLHDHVWAIRPKESATPAPAPAAAPADVAAGEEAAAAEIPEGARRITEFFAGGAAKEPAAPAAEPATA